ncbi:MAG: hypothetical protein NUK54_07480, partial [Methanothrix sp.]|nr:hypothetical protein [Methanothrix sp.]
MPPGSGDEALRRSGIDGSAAGALLGGMADDRNSGRQEKEPKKRRSIGYDGLLSWEGRSPPNAPFIS